MNRHIRHVTLQTGHSRASPRSEVGDDVVEELCPLLTRALRGEQVPVPGQPGYTMRGGAEGRCAIVTVYGQAGETASPEPVPILTVGIAGHSRCGATLWRILHRDHLGAPLVTDPESQPVTPWCADRVELGLALMPEAAEWTGDLSRCIAWAWLDQGP